MKWRCPQCGRPHERNDPPCENCGHHKLERAVVPHASEAEGREQFVWACSQCGRHHQRNNPPCSRCGNATFEKKTLEYDEFDPGDTKGYRELVGRTEIGLAIVVVLLLGVGVLGYFGVVDVPGLTPKGQPTVADVPGDSERIGEIPLADVEDAVLTDIEERRGGSSLQRADGLDSIATYHVRVTAKALIQEERPTAEVEEYRRFDTPCNGLPNFGFGRLPTALVGDASAETLASEIVIRTDSDDPEPTASRISSIGVGSHAGPDGTLYVVVAYC